VDFQEVRYKDGLPKARGAAVTGHVRKPDGAMRVHATHRFDCIALGRKRRSQYGRSQIIHRRILGMRGVSERLPDDRQ
jgi:hypothetical protein